MGLEDGNRKCPFPTHSNSSKRIRTISPTNADASEGVTAPNSFRDVTESTFETGDDNEGVSDVIVSDNNAHHTSTVFDGVNKLPDYVLILQRKFPHHSDFFRALEAYRSYHVEKEEIVSGDLNDNEQDIHILCTQ